MLHGRSSFIVVFFAALFFGAVTTASATDGDQDVKAKTKAVGRWFKNVGSKTKDGVVKGVDAIPGVEVVSDGDKANPKNDVKDVANRFADKDEAPAVTAQAAAPIATNVRLEEASVSACSLTIPKGQKYIECQTGVNKDVAWKRVLNLLQGSNSYEKVIGDKDSDTITAVREGKQTLMGNYYEQVKVIFLGTDDANPTVRVIGSEGRAGRNISGNASAYAKVGEVGKFDFNKEMTEKAAQAVFQAITPTTRPVSTGGND